MDEEMKRRLAYRQLREKVRQRGLERIRQLVEHDTPTDEILAAVEDFAHRFRDIS